MTLARRVFLKTSAAGLAGISTLPSLLATEPTAAGAAAGAKIRLSARESCFGGSLEVAKRCALDGVELGVGGPAEKLRLADVGVRQKHKEELQKLGLVVSSLSMDLLNGRPMATDPQAPEWLAQTIEAAKDFGAAGILVPFFGNAHIKDVDIEPLAARLKEAAPKAKDAGVVLGLENMLPAKKNLEILDRIGSDSVGVYYDIGNATGAGYDVPAELRMLKGRLCMIHFKDGGSYLGEGKVKMEPVAAVLQAIEYRGWIVLETACPTKDCETDCQRNVAYVRKLMSI